MPIAFNDFLLKATSTHFGSRDIVVNDARNAQSVKHGNLIFSSGQKLNDATMTAFKEALQQEYGVFGTHAFDTVIGSRAQLHKSLRACDIKAVASQMETLKQKRFANEEARQLETSPQVLALDPQVRKTVQDIIRSHWQGPNHDQLTEHTLALKNCRSHEDISELASNTIMMAIQLAKSQHANAADTVIQPLTQGESQPEAGKPMGLSKLSDIPTFNGRATSVEDHVKSGWAGAGMRVNFGDTSRPVILEKLKTNGVEPGFIYRNDWSQQDTSALQIDIRSQATMTSVNAFIAQSPTLAQQAQGKTDIEKGLLVGRAHPAGVAFATEYVLSQELDKLAQNPQPDTPLLRAIKQHFGPNVQKTDFFPANGGALTPQQQANMDRVKKDCFIQLRDAVMTYGKTAAATDPNAQLPVFKHFTERHILKLDYNEGDRVSTKGAASTGEFHLPERVKNKGAIYYHRRVTTADAASVGAVAEAFANDLTRLLGVPAQDLTLVRGQYSDGHPKIMLEAKFAEGYHDFEDGFIEDGRTVGNVEALGKFKAIFLALADRDAIGSHGQNKGVINGKFFAIDPGHSLEGSGAKLEIRDNLSFSDTDWRTKIKIVDHFTKRFRNYTVFDDDTRFAKMQGVLTLREMCKPAPPGQLNAIEQLAADYKSAFDPNKQGISAEEKKIRLQTTAKIDQMLTEFQAQTRKIIDVCSDQLQLYDDLENDPNTKPLQEGAIETIENLEKLTSPTTWTSKHGKVDLTHLSVSEEKRIPWTAQKVGNTLVYTSKKPLSPEMQQQLRTPTELLEQPPNIAFDAEGKATITVQLDQAQAFFDAFTEDNIAQITHPEEARQRADDMAAKAKFQRDTAETAVNLEKLTSPTAWRGAPNAPNERFLTVPQQTRIPWQVETRDGNLVFTSGPIHDQNALARLISKMDNNISTRFKLDPQSKATITVPVKHAQLFFNALSEQEVAKVKHPAEFRQYETQAAAQPVVQQPNVQPPPAGVQPQAPHIDNPPPNGQ